MNNQNNSSFEYEEKFNRATMFFSLIFAKILIFALIFGYYQ